MRYPDINDYIRFLFSMLDDFFNTQENVRKSGRPQTYSEAALIVFYATMTLKGITAMRAQHNWLFHHPVMLERFQLPRCPSHVTLGQRYKALLPQLNAFTEYIAASSFARAAGFLQEVVYEDKSLFKVAGVRLASEGSAQGSSSQRLTRCGYNGDLVEKWVSRMGVWIWAPSHQHSQRVSRDV